MQVLPTGFSLPPLVYVVVLLGAAGLVSAILYAIDPDIEQKYILAFAPWMAVGGALHAFHQVGLYPPTFRPLFGTPAVYVTGFVLAAVAWVAMELYGVMRAHPEQVPRNLGLLGTGVLTVLFVLLIYQAINLQDIQPVWPVIGFILAGLLTGVMGLIIGLWRTPIFVRTRYVGPTVIFAHALDGVTTAIGKDVFAVPEKTPIPRAILGFAEGLPTAQYIGAGWLFVLVKLVVATAVVVGLHRYVEDEPGQATLVMTLVAAVGLGPATNNLFLFVLGTAA